MVYQNSFEVLRLGECKSFSSKREPETLLGGAFGLSNRPFDIGRLSGKAMPPDKNDKFALRNNPTNRVQGFKFECQSYINV
ncbi:hypothetical protein BET10_20355 [Pseudoalteromonas amylolytica]|uniref:Uncharacterized protein n=1 Tax=Pseudoalteromonas amylolytica TaxID=1859457 RepID=A0A1S1MQI4_9GAMM|nr:hypothetical protein BFC16_18040 [Pseudoalteromonas sp. JW3]OHU87298.1 hypothetical protein BET10_20355 [Pseudoalteromonas amylolytica]